MWAMKVARTQTKIGETRRGVVLIVLMMMMMSWVKEGIPFRLSLRLELIVACCLLPFQRVHHSMFDCFSFSLRSSGRGVIVPLRHSVDTATVTAPVMSVWNGTAGDSLVAFGTSCFVVCVSFRLCLRFQRTPIPSDFRLSLAARLRRGVVAAPPLFHHLYLYSQNKAYLCLCDCDHDQCLVWVYSCWL